MVSARAWTKQWQGPKQRLGAANGLFTELCSLKAEAYVALTNNKNRGKKPNAGGDDTSVNGPNPRTNNQYGQIVRWSSERGDHASSNFKWDIFALVGNPAVHKGPNAGSKT